MAKASWAACLLLFTALMATAGEPDGPWRKTLDDGSVVEVVGVSTSPSGPETWWSPDGTPLDEAPYEYPFDGGTVKKGEMAREFAVRLTTPDDDASLSASAETHKGNSVRSSRSTRVGRVTTLVGPSRAIFSDDETTCSVRGSGGLGPWRTEARSKPNTMTSAGNGRGVEVVFAGSWELANGNTLVVTSFFMKKERPCRVVVVDRSGALQTCDVGAGMGDADRYQYADEFKLKHADIKEILAQTRPYYRVTFPGVALHPKKRP